MNADGPHSLVLPAARFASISAARLRHPDRRGLLAHAGQLIRPLLSRPRVVIVTDANVGPCISRRSRVPRRCRHRPCGVVLPAGEQTKSFAHLEELAERLLALRIERRTDTRRARRRRHRRPHRLRRRHPFARAGFRANPDDSVGAGRQRRRRQDRDQHPRTARTSSACSISRAWCIADVATLDSLDCRQLRAGYAEVVKYGLIGDAPFFAWLEANGPALLAGDVAARIEAVRVSCRAKAGIVAADEREAGVRALLNLGHTFAHALEAETGFGETPAARRGGRRRHGARLRSVGSTRPLRSGRRRPRPAASGGGGAADRSPFLARTPPERLIEHMQGDKKVVDGRLTFILARRIGDAFVDRSTPVERRPGAPRRCPCRLRWGFPCNRSICR